MAGRPIGKCALASSYQVLKFCTPYWCGTHSMDRRDIHACRTKYLNPKTDAKLQEKRSRSYQTLRTLNSSSINNVRKLIYCLIILYNTECSLAPPRLLADISPAIQLVSSKDHCPIAPTLQRSLYSQQIYSWPPASARPGLEFK